MRCAISGLTSHFRALPATIVAVLGLTVAGCAGGFEAQYPATQKTAPGQALIGFADPTFNKANTARVSHRGPFEHVEYARFEADGLTLEAVYDVALGVGFVLEYDYWMQRMANTWNVNQGQAVAWGPKKTVQAWHGGIDYQPYRLANTNRSCVAFNSTWDYQPRDPFGRPSRVLFGYVCADPGKPLSEKRVADLLQGIALSDRSGESFVPPFPRRTVDQLAFNTAKGSEGSAGGNAEFPFNFGTPYFGEDGSNFGD